MDFFPSGALDPRPELHTFKNRWYVSHLLAMREQPMYPPSAVQSESYRLLYLPTFEHPTAVRLTNSKEGWITTCKRSDGLGGYGAGQFAAESERHLSQVEVQQLSSLLFGFDFWALPSSEQDSGCDGTQAILEGVCGGVYHVVDRWCPHGTPYAEMVEFLLSLCPPEWDTAGEP